MHHVEQHLHYSSQHGSQQHVQYSSQYNSAWQGVTASVARIRATPWAE
jgi:hypothetical protein